MDTNIMATITSEQWAAIAEFAAERAAGKVEVSQPQTEQGEDSEKQLYKRVSSLLLRIGIPAHLKGHPYIKEAVVLVYKDRDYIEAITKRLYPEIAKKFGTTPSRVERAVRHAFEVAVDNGDPENFMEIFTMSPFRGKPTNSEAIAGMVEYLKNS